MRRLLLAALAAGIVSVMAVAIATAHEDYSTDEWPMTCVDLNDIVEEHLGNPHNVGIYQNTFGDQAEAACQNDHRNDVTAVFGWAIATETGWQAQATDLELDWPTTCVELNDIVEGHLGNQGNVAIYQNTFGDQAEAACQNDHRNDVRSVFAWAIGTTAAAPPAASAQRFVAVSSGGYHTCALREGGEPVCWGAEAAKNQKVYIQGRQHGQASPPEGERLVAISSGALHTCGLRQDGTAVCWGQNEFGQASPPASERFVAISSGGRTRVDCARMEPRCAGAPTATAKHRRLKANGLRPSAAAAVTLAGCARMAGSCAGGTSRTASVRHRGRDCV